MVLKDNVLLEFTMPILSNAAAKCRPLATKALSQALTARVHGGFRLPV
jgi:hypothetical protein